MAVKVRQAYMKILFGTSQIVFTDFLGYFHSCWSSRGTSHSFYSLGRVSD